MPQRWLCAAAALAALAGCKPEAPAAAPEANAAQAPAASPAGIDSAAAGEPSALRDWLIGTWSFEKSCATDFIVHYNADGALDNAGEIGNWSIAGDEVTESILEKFENGGEEPVRLAVPEKRSYTVARIDQRHGTITYQGRKVPMLRC